MYQASSQVKRTEADGQHAIIINPPPPIRSPREMSKPAWACVGVHANDCASLPATYHHAPIFDPVVLTILIFQIIAFQVLSWQMGRFVRSKALGAGRCTRSSVRVRQLISKL